MICIANSCGQDSRNCKTPWRCSGKYESQAHHAAMTAPVGSFYPRDMAITLEGPEPADPPLYTPSQAMLWPDWLAVAVVLGFFLYAVAHVAGWL